MNGISFKRTMCIIWFNHPRVLEFLIEHGEVYTLRGHLKKCTGHVVILSRYGYKAYGVVRLIKVIDLKEPSELEVFVDKSGFRTIEEWLSAFRELNGDVNTAYLYYVKIEKPLLDRLRHYLAGG